MMELKVVSQFTLYAVTAKGAKPDFHSHTYEDMTDVREYEGSGGQIIIQPRPGYISQRSARW